MKETFFVFLLLPANTKPKSDHSLNTPYFGIETKEKSKYNQGGPERAKERDFDGSEKGF